MNLRLALISFSLIAASIAADASSSAAATIKVVETTSSSSVQAQTATSPAATNEKQSTTTQLSQSQATPIEESSSSSSISTSSEKEPTSNQQQTTTTSISAAVSVDYASTGATIPTISAGGYSTTTYDSTSHTSTLNQATSGSETLTLQTASSSSSSASVYTDSSSPSPAYTSTPSTTSTSYASSTDIPSLSTGYTSSTDIPSLSTGYTSSTDLSSLNTPSTTSTGYASSTDLSSLNTGYASSTDISLLSTGYTSSTDQSTTTGQSSLSTSNFFDSYSIVGKQPASIATFSSSSSTDSYDSLTTPSYGSSYDAGVSSPSYQSSYGSAVSSSSYGADTTTNTYDIVPFGQSSSFNTYQPSNTLSSSGFLSGTYDSNTYDYGHSYTDTPYSSYGLSSSYQGGGDTNYPSTITSSPSSTSSPVGAAYSATTTSDLNGIEVAIVQWFDNAGKVISSLVSSVSSDINDALYPSTSYLTTDLNTITRTDYPYVVEIIGSTVRYEVNGVPSSYFGAETVTISTINAQPTSSSAAYSQPSSYAHYSQPSSNDQFGQTNYISTDYNTITATRSPYVVVIGGKTVYFEINGIPGSSVDGSSYTIATVGASSTNSPDFDGGKHQSYSQTYSSYSQNIPSFSAPNFAPYSSTSTQEYTSKPDNNQGDNGKGGHDHTDAHSDVPSSYSAHTSFGSAHTSFDSSPSAVSESVSRQVASQLSFLNNPISQGDNDHSSSPYVAPAISSSHAAPAISSSHAAPASSSAFVVPASSSAYVAPQSYESHDVASSSVPAADNGHASSSYARTTLATSQAAASEAVTVSSYYADQSSQVTPPKASGQSIQGSSIVIYSPSSDTYVAKTIAASAYVQSEVSAILSSKTAEVSTKDGSVVTVAPSSTTAHWLPTTLQTAAGVVSSSSAGVSEKLNSGFTETLDQQQYSTTTSFKNEKSSSAPQLPNAIAPATEATVEQNYTVITIGFKSGLNYPFVVDHSLASAQIFQYLPGALTFVFGSQDSGVTVKQLVPFKSSELGYIVTVAEVYFPKDWVSTLNQSIQTSYSNFYFNTDPTENSLAQLVDTSIPLDLELGSDSITYATETATSSMAVAQATETVGLSTPDSGSFDSSTTENKSSNPQLTKTAIGSGFSAAVYISVLLAGFKIYKKRKGISTFAVDRDGNIILPISERGVIDSEKPNEPQLLLNPEYEDPMLQRRISYQSLNSFGTFGVNMDNNTIGSRDPGDIFSIQEERDDTMDEVETIIPSMTNPGSIASWI